MSEESSPASSAVAVTTDKSEVTFTEKETRLIVAAIMSLKSGMPEVDYQRFQKHAGFNTLKTAQNTWATLRKKIKEANPEAYEAAEAEPKTPKSKATPKKRKAASDDGTTANTDAEDDSPKKKPRTPRKKKDSVADGEEEAETPPKKTKTPRKTPVKKGKKSEETVAEHNEDAGVREEGEKSEAAASGADDKEAAAGVDE